MRDFVTSEEQVKAAVDASARPAGSGLLAELRRELNAIRDEHDVQVGLALDGRPSD
jgi:hypothetical protein